MSQYTKFIFIALLGSSVIACSPASSPDDTGELSPSGSAAPLTTQEYDSLTAMQKYQVANKLMGTFFKGVSADEFFVPSSITSDETTLVVSNAGDNYVQSVRNALSVPLQADEKSAIYSDIVGSPATETEPAIAGKYRFTDSDVRFNMEFPSAYMYELPISDEYFARWIAYRLVNTILFSPAEEIDSADQADVQKVYEELSTAILNDAPIRSIIFAHETSQANWRRFRSPEDNTREMIEIYLGLFDRDDDVPRASRACRNWSLTDEDAGYVLVINNAFENDEPQIVFDNVSVRTCEDFFRAVSDHPLVIPRMATVLVDLMLEISTAPEIRAAMVQAIVNSNPTTFREIFTHIIFSSTYLLDTERPMWAEEVFYNTAAKVQWIPYNGFFRDFNRSSSRGEPGTINTSLALMYQPAFSLKLGRFPVVPQDALGSAYLHRAVRDTVMIRRSNGNEGSLGWNPALVNNRGSVALDDFISYLFLTVIARMPTADELVTLSDVITSATSSGGGSLNIANNLTEKTRVVLDYLGRLPETYYFTAVN